MENINLKLSVLDIEKKYKYDYEETCYGKDNIVSYGKDNDAPLLFKNCYRNSSTLSGIINGMVNYILGDAVVVNDSAAKFKEKVNRSGMNMRQFVSNLALSYGIYGGFAFQVIYSKLGVPVELFPLDFSRCRTNESGTKIYYSKKNWTKYTTKSEVFDRFDRSNVKSDKPTQIFYYKGDFTNNVYPLPPYFSAIKDVLTEIECANYSLNSVSNGFSAKYLFNIPETGNLTDEQKRDIGEAIKTKFCGSETEANFMLYWTDGEQTMDIKKIESDDSPERFIAIKNDARACIYAAMRCTPNLMGLPTETTGFNAQEYSSAFKLYQKTVIQNIQDIIVESIGKVLGASDAISIVPFTISFDEENKE